MAKLKHSLRSYFKTPIFSLEKNFICFSGNLYRKKAIFKIGIFFSFYFSSIGEKYHFCIYLRRLNFSLHFDKILFLKFSFLSTFKFILILFLKTLQTSKQQRLCSKTRVDALLNMLC